MKKEKKIAEIPALRVVPISEVMKQRNNTNKGKEGGWDAIEKSFRKFKAMRSGVASNGLEMFAGSHSLQAAMDAGITEVLVVPHDGTRYVVLERTDLHPERDAALIAEASIADNATHETSFSWDYEMVAEQSAEFGFDVADWGVEIPEESDMPDYSGKNKEIDTDAFDDKCSITLNYTLEEFHQVKTELSKIAGTPEQAVWQLLKLQ